MIRKSVLLLLLTGYPVWAALIQVPNDQSTIQGGINSAITGDTVLVHPGIYRECIRFNGKNIIVASLYLTTLDTSKISSTIIDGLDKYQSPVRIVDGENDQAVLCGFTICNGRGSIEPHMHDDFPTERGGGVYVFESSPTLHHLYIRKNNARAGGGIFLYKSHSKVQAVRVCTNRSLFGGGGIYCWESFLSFVDVMIGENYTEASGGGLSVLVNSEVTLDRAVLYDNVAEGDGGGIMCAHASKLRLSRVTMANNRSWRSASALSIYNDSQVDVINSIVWGDLFLWGSLFPLVTVDKLGVQSRLNIIHTDITGGSSGGITGPGDIKWFGTNLSAEPLFSNASIHDYSLRKESPCIDQGVAFFELNGETMIHLLPQDYLGANPDLGAFEFDPIVAVADGDGDDPHLDFEHVQVYPNPFNSSTSITFNLAVQSPVLLTIHDCRGAAVKRLTFSGLNSGMYEVPFSAENLGSGLYFLVLETNRCRAVVKCAIIK